MLHHTNPSPTTFCSSCRFLHHSDIGKERERVHLVPSISSVVLFLFSVFTINSNFFKILILSLFKQCKKYSSYSCICISRSAQIKKVKTLRKNIKNYLYYFFKLFFQLTKEVGSSPLLKEYTSLFLLSFPHLLLRYTFHVFLFLFSFSFPSLYLMTIFSKFSFYPYLYQV